MANQTKGDKMNITLNIPTDNIKKYVMKQIYQTNHRQLMIMMEEIISTEIKKQLKGKRFEAILKDCIYSNINMYTVKEIKKIGKGLK